MTDPLRACADMPLPPLPKKSVIFTVMPDDFRYGHVYGYTEKQMRDYAKRAIEQAAPRGERVCEWIEHGLLNYATECGADTTITRGLNPSILNVTFCGYCGGKIQVKEAGK